MQNLFNKPYPFNDDYKHNTKIIFFISIGVFIFLLLFQPFDINLLTTKEKYYLIIGFVIITYLLIQVPVILISHVIGLWLFYIQHQFDETSWERNSNWNYKTAAFKGSSFLKLPAILQ